MTNRMGKYGADKARLDLAYAEANYPDATYVDENGFVGKVVDVYRKRLEMAEAAEALDAERDANDGVVFESMYGTLHKEAR